MYVSKVIMLIFTCKIKNSMDDHKQVNIEKLLKDNRERLKELNALNKTTSIIRENKSFDDTLQNICLILPSAMQYSEHCVARIRYMDKEYTSHLFFETKWRLAKSFKTFDNLHGVVEVFYTQGFPDADDGPFLHEEDDFLNNVAYMIAGYISSFRARQLFEEAEKKEMESINLEISQKDKYNKRFSLLQKYWSKVHHNRDIFHDLMTFKVKEILLIATLYDAYSLEKEGRIAEHVLGEYQQLNLTSMPRITAVEPEELEIFEKLQSKHYDLIIYMISADTRKPILISEKIKKEYPYIPIYFLLNTNVNEQFYSVLNQKKIADKLYIWNGISNLFFAMVKNLEDMKNVDNDTRIGLVRVILVIEDDPAYYSRYLPLLYTIVLEQTRDIINDVSTDDLYKVLKLRARPKILHVSNYEDALDLYFKYKEFLLCVISDVKFIRNGELDETAGFDLVSKIREDNPELPIILQSSDISNAKKSFELKSTFVDKNSETLVADIKSFIKHYLGFGHFVYRSPDGKELAVAKSMKEFEEHLRTIPDDSLLYHAQRNHFSLWMMARGEIQIARILAPRRASEFESLEKIREYLIKIINTYRYEQEKGKLIRFDNIVQLDEGFIVTLSDGSLGGKGRGIAFINTLLYSFDLSKLFPDIILKAPRTCIIGTDEFDYFMDKNNLYDVVRYEEDYKVIRKAFLSASLNEGLIKKLRRLLKFINKPIAVRSSGQFEDSPRLPFAGIYETYLIPNSNQSFDERLRQLMDAIKMVYASVFSNVARGYVHAMHTSIEQEKMAIILQEVVGNQYGQYFYPHISGVAQSYNYYPFAHMTPEDGFAVIALGLGKHVVEGGKAYRFSPKYPTTEISSLSDIIQNTQTDFLAIDLSKDDLNLFEGEMAGLSRLDIQVAEQHGNLRHLASVYDEQSNVLLPGISIKGPRVLNFANILRYNYIPLAKTIEVLLELVEDAIGAPVEIEFAVDLTRSKELKSTFYLLQIKPYIGSGDDYEVDTAKLNKDQLLLYAEKSMGNGLIDTINDVIYVRPENFDKTQTLEIAKEIEIFNKKMKENNIEYILIGPGRWGTRDRFIGIPVNWAQISNAKVIVETSLENFPLDASMGSHFFYNVTSMQIGYCSVQHNAFRSFIAWDILSKQKIIEETRFVRHVSFQNPLIVKMDGKKRITVIQFSQ